MNDLVTVILKIVNLTLMVSVGFAILATMYMVIYAGISVAKGRRVDPVDIGVVIVIFWLIPVGLKTVPPAVLNAMVEGWQQSEAPAQILQDELRQWVESSLSENVTPQIDAGTDTTYTVEGGQVTAVPTPQVVPTETAVPLPTSTPEPTQLVVDPNIDISAKATENAAQVTRMPEATPTTFYCPPDLTLEDMQAGCLPPINR